MNHTRALRLAVKALEYQIKAIAVDANLHDVYHSDAPSCLAASIQRKELREAIVALELPKRIREQHMQEALEL